MKTQTATAPAVVIVHSETETEIHIDAQAQESAALLTGQGWTWRSEGIYTLLSGDVEALSDKLGRETTREERIALETAIRLYLGR